MKNTRFTSENNNEVAFLFKIHKVVLEIHDKLIQVDNDLRFLLSARRKVIHMYFSFCLLC